MTRPSLTDAIHSLTPEQQESVRQFIEFLKQKELRASSPFLAAVEEFH